MSTFKKSTVVMLPTEKASSLFLYNSDKHILFFEHGRDLTAITTHFEIYILSDEEIKEGDWYYSFQIGFSGGINQYQGGAKLTSWKKIIATTDKSLGEIPNSISVFNFPDKLGLPQPSKQFIEVFIQEYNKGNIITEVMVEYNEERYISGIVDCGDGNLWESGYYEPETLKVNPKDNTITIRKVKDSWSREEVEEKLNDLHLFIRANAISDNSVRIHISKMVKEWIKENL